MPPASAALAEQEAHKKWAMLASAEDLFLKQRSRIQWTSKGDANTSFYHRAIKTIRDQSQIDFFIDEDDGIIDSLELRTTRSPISLTSSEVLWLKRPPFHKTSQISSPSDALNNQLHS